MWSLNPIPTINTEHTLKQPSTLPTPIIPRKALIVRVFQKDQSGEFSDYYKINSFKELCGKECLEGFSCMKKKMLLFSTMLCLMNKVCHKSWKA